MQMARPRIFATGVFGSDFDVWGAQSFTDAGTRDRLGREFGPNDYCLTIGMTSKADVPEEERGRLLALIKLGSEPVMTADLVEPRKWQESLNRYGQRWMYAFPVRSVERFDAPPLRSVVLPRIDRRLYRKVGRHYVELTPDEVDRVLALPRTPDTNIYSTPIREFASRLRNSRRGPKPSSKTRTLSPKSGPAVTYSLKLVGTLAGDLKKALGLSADKDILKVGFSTNFNRRLAAINAYFPCEEALRWEEYASQGHEDEINAWAMEQRVFDLLQKDGISPTKGEIFCASLGDLEEAWGKATQTAKRPNNPVVVDIDEQVVGSPLSRD